MPNLLVQDESVVRSHLVPNGGASLSSSQAKFGAQSLSINGVNGSYFKGILDADAFDFGSENFTVEGWIYPTAASTGVNTFPGVISRRDTASTNISWLIFLNGGTGAGSIFFLYAPGGTSASNSSAQSASSVPLNQWSHFAAVRNGTSITMYLNGVGGTANTVGTASLFNAPLPMLVGQLSHSDANNNFNGFIDSIRITRGVARYTANFTPPTQEFPNNSTDDPNWNKVVLLVKGDLVSASPILLNDVLFESVYTPPATNFQAVDDASKLFDLQYGGAGRIFGTVKVDSSPDVPVYRRVWLMNQRDAVVIRETWSDQITGEYEFANIDETQTYSVISFDHTNNFRAVIADSVVPELMP